MKKIEANIIAHSSSPFGEELITFEVTFPKIILPEVLTHRMFSRNTSSSRAIPFKKMVEAVKENPFIPYAWQKDHKGMQGDKYITDETTISRLNTEWLRGRDKAVEYATYLHDLGLTKQLCNRLLDPYIWTRMIITTTTYGLENFFKLRAPKYRYVDVKGNKTYFTTRTEWWEAQSQNEKDEFLDRYKDNPYLWYTLNESQAEIHIQELAEQMSYALKNSTPKLLQPGEWHIPYEDQIEWLFSYDKVKDSYTIEEYTKLKMKVATAMCARVSYTTIGDEKEIDYEKMVKLHDKLIELRHDSPLEHCARAMSEEEYYSYHNGLVEGEFDSHPEIGSFFRILEGHKFMRDKRNGWCNNFKGFIPYRYIIENKLDVRNYGEA